MENQAKPPRRSNEAADAVAVGGTFSGFSKKVFVGLLSLVRGGAVSLVTLQKVGKNKRAFMCRASA